MYTFSKRKNNFFIPNILQDVLKALQEHGAKPVLVGGCVRDYFLDLEIKDYDVEIFNLNDYEHIAKILSAFGTVKLVGKSFGVLKLSTREYEFDFALPRVEKKVGVGYTGFEIITDASMSFKQASIRRDFTINAIGYDYCTQQFIDPYDGLKDLENKTLRHINEETFVEDPLRVYRAIQFCARFEFTLDSQTKRLCQTLVQGGEMQTLSSNRIFEEFKKLLLKAKRPSLGFELLKELKLLPFFPELEALVDCPQEPEYHPEGDVWIHTLLCLDEMAKLRTSDAFKNLYLMLAILCHDLGKPATTEVINGKITSYKHEKEGIVPTLSFLEKLTNDKKLIKNVVELVEYHLAPFQLFLQQSSRNAVKRLSNKVNIEDLCLISQADCLGRTLKDKSKCYEAVSWLLKVARELHIENEALKPLVLGRDLIALGFKPDKTFKTILAFAYEVQIENEEFSKEDILEAISKKYRKYYL